MSSSTQSKSTSSESSRAVNLHDSWLQHLQPEFDQPYMQTLSRFLRSEKQARKRIFPSGELIFNALNTTPLDKVKVVILGQDPYHGPNQAHGLSFSVPPGIAIPPSLRNIYQELHTDLGVIAPQSGHLHAWAEQGVLLLNAVLTVEAGQAASHQGKGWEQFTDAIVALLNQQLSKKVFMLWGSYAQKKGAVIDGQKHLVLKAPHPSPLSAHRGFFGCRHFSKANECLEQWGRQPINWQL